MRDSGLFLELREKRREESDEVRNGGGRCCSEKEQRHTAQGGKAEPRIWHGSSGGASLRRQRGNGAGIAASLRDVGVCPAPAAGLLLERSL